MQPPATGAEIFIVTLGAKVNAGQTRRRPAIAQTAFCLGPYREAAHPQNADSV